MTLLQSPKDPVLPTLIYIDQPLPFTLVSCQRSYTQQYKIPTLLHSRNSCSVLGCSVGLFTQFISLYFDTAQVSKIVRICSETDEFEKTLGKWKKIKEIDFSNFSCRFLNPNNFN